MRLSTKLAAVLVALTGSCAGCPEQCQIPGFLSPEELAFCPDTYDLELRLESGGSQRGLAGADLTDPVVFLVVTDYTNLPRVGVKDVEVTVSVVEGGGAVTNDHSAVPNQTSATYETDSNGRITVRWRTGRTPGTNRLSARIVSTAVTHGGANTVTVNDVTGSPQSVSATGDPRPITGMSIFGGNDQTATVGTAVPIPPSVQVTDALGLAVGEPVTFLVELGDGTLAGAVAHTDGNGVATVGGWELGPTAGPNRLRVEAGNLKVNITATGVAGPAVTMSKVAGDDQRLTSNGALRMQLPIAPRIRLLDQYGNPVRDVPIQFQVGPGGGITNSNQDTDDAGEAAVGLWEVSSQPGEYTVTASVTGSAPGEIAGDPAVFSARVIPNHGPPTTMTEFAGSGQMVGVGQPVPTLPAVRITDAQGRPVPGVTITFAAGIASGTITGTTPVTDANGVATVGGWTLGTTAGTQYVIATAPAGSGIVPSNLAIQVTALPDAPNTLAKIAGDNQVGFAGSPVFTRPAVAVRDQYGNGVPGVTVVFAVTGGGGTVSGATQTTDAQGRAFVGAWTLGGVPGPNTLAATVPPPVGNTMVTSSVSFVATGTVGESRVAPSRP